MGGACSAESKEKAQQKKLNFIAEGQLRKARQDFMNEIKLLLLGTGESGKSTIAKQMKIIHTGGFTHEERLAFKPIAFYNVVISMRALIEAIPLLKLEISPPNRERAENFLKDHERINSPSEELTQEMADEVTALWNDPGIQEAYALRSHLQLMDSAKYCFENVHRFANPSWVPIEDDILRMRARTTGIVETTFTIKDSYFRMIDVGGQRNERKKWIHCFQDVTAIIYCVALNEYDMQLLEDETVNRMVESLELFEYIAQSKWFTKTAIILFLNKSDLFREKIATVSPAILFPEYEGGCNYDAGLEFIQHKFMSKSTTGKKIFAHVTQATDTNNIRVVFNAAREVIISQNLERLGFGAL